MNAYMWITPSPTPKPEILPQAAKTSALKRTQTPTSLSGVKGTLSVPTPLSFPTLKTVPSAKTLQNDYFIIQSFNNCGPASLSMLLSYYGIQKSQEELGEELRPYQNPIGDNDDKSVTLDEIAQKAKEYNLTPYHLPNGSIEILKKFIANDIPILTRTWLAIDDDIGHYRIIKGYSDEDQTLIQDDSYLGQNLSYSYVDFNALWEKFNYEYLILVPKNKEQIAKSIIGKNIDQRTAWQQARQRNIQALEQNPDDIYSRFNLAIASYYLTDYQKTIQEYEKIQAQLPFRTLWYQREPIEAYYNLGNYDKVFAITDNILNNENRAYSELYILRGKIHQKQGNAIAAKQEFENAIYYNPHLKEAQTALKSLENTKEITTNTN
jgi:tetratricopeptide (TPR) repeat protein